MSVFQPRGVGQMMHLLYIFGLPLYFLAFTVILRPEFVLLLLGEDEFIARIASASMELLVSLVFTRCLYKRLYEHVSNMMWCVLEMFVMSFVLALFIGFEPTVYIKCLTYVFLVLALPQWTIHMRINQSISARLIEELSANGKVRFYDENGKLKIAIAAGDIIYIKADDNYIKIYYLSESVVRESVVRTSMKSIEELCQYHGILRSHRSYFVNPNHVTWLGRDDKDEVYAILDVPDMPHIPVTKRYFDRVAEKFS
jgi:hypothetical protein